MTREEKKLLLIDLCARLPYEVYIEIVDEDGNVYDEVELEPQHINTVRYDESISIRPYLRPMSSMTEEEIEEYRNLSDEVIGSYGHYHREFSVHCVRLGIKPDNPHECVDDFLNMEAIDWLNKKGFDYRGLIPMGLALEAHEDMYKTE